MWMQTERGQLLNLDLATEICLGEYEFQDSRKVSAIWVGDHPFPAATGTLAEMKNVMFEITSVLGVGENLVGPARPEGVKA